jgi:hypothetical protein
VCAAEDSGSDCSGLRSCQPMSVASDGSRPQSIGMSRSGEGIHLATTLVALVIIAMLTAHCGEGGDRHHCLADMGSWNEEEEYCTRTSGPCSEARAWWTHPLHRRSVLARLAVRERPGVPRHGPPMHSRTLLVGLPRRWRLRLLPVLGHVPVLGRGDTHLPVDRDCRLLLGRRRVSSLFAVPGLSASLPARCTHIGVHTLVLDGDGLPTCLRVQGVVLPARHRLGADGGGIPGRHHVRHRRVLRTVQGIERVRRSANGVLVRDLHPGAPMHGDVGLRAGHLVHPGEVLFRRRSRRARGALR